MAEPYLDKVYFTCRIDTTKYSGDFEREMACFITGEGGQSGINQTLYKEANLALSAIQRKWFNRCILLKNNSGGSLEVGCIAPTPEWYNDGKGNHFVGEGLYPAYQSVQICFTEEPPKEIRKLIWERALLFCDVKNGNSLINELTVLDIVFSKVYKIIKHI